MEHWERDKRVWSFFGAALGGWLRRKFNYEPETVRAEGPYLVLCNHATDWDPLLLGLAFPGEQMYFVASEHIFRWGLAYKAIDWLTHPIARLKGTTAADTVLRVMRYMKKGANVAIFAEGNRTWDGRTGYILPATGKLARSCGGTLITYRLEGGYFTSPRWSGASLRRGRMKGSLVGVYTHEELKKMTAGEVSALIDRDLFEDAYARQEREPVAYRGKNLAEGLETMLCLCPKCSALGKMRSEGDRFYCESCGAAARYTEFGYLEGDFPFRTVPEWDAWQAERLFALADGAAEGETIFSDIGVSLSRLRDDGESYGEESLGTGELSMTPTVLSCAGYGFPLADITGMGLHGPLGMSFSVDKEHYELSAVRPDCVRKYMQVFEYLREHKKEKEVAANDNTRV